MVFQKQEENEIIEYVRTLPTKSIDVKSYNKKRSLRQNDLYWEILTIVADNEGMNKNELHEHMKYMFSDKIESTFLGHYIVFPRSTAEMDVKEFSNYLDEVIYFFTSEGYYLPTLEQYNL